MREQRKAPMNLTKKYLAVAAISAMALGILPGAANAHVSVYVAGVSGAAVAAAGGTYEVDMAPGHGCTGPRTESNPDGAYDTIRTEVFMPRTSTGAFIFPEVRIVDKADYKATLKWVADPTNAAAKRVSSIVYEYLLPAVNNGYAARDTVMLGFTVKLPTKATLDAAGYALATDSVAIAGSTGAKVYLPTKQYCDVRHQGIGVQAATSTPAAVTATVDPACVSADTREDELVDDWTTVGNTPSLVIGTATTTTYEFLSNKPTTTAAAAEKFCSFAGGFNPRSVALAGKVSTSLKASGAKTTSFRIVATAPASYVGRTLTVKTESGATIGAAKVPTGGTWVLTAKGKKAALVKTGDQLVISWKGNGVGVAAF